MILTCLLNKHVDATIIYLSKAILGTYIGLECKIDRFRK